MIYLKNEGASCEDAPTKRKKAGQDIPALRLLTQN